MMAISIERKTSIRIPDEEEVKLELASAVFGGGTIAVYLTANELTEKRGGVPPSVTCIEVHKLNLIIQECVYHLSFNCRML
ncbi:hypothetical protein DPMN_136941 [Dreissena polymorpha]|uniref:Uncharacterized protein n=1 Tax=Dreissena polymorpha TaxID=45954 RepID=A0A9D4G0V6_DREPO|nr:hypothetical protein DPMN_136941 [Dreissena polymorpha]